MYTEISLNVIRQSLAWLGIPAPLVIHGNRAITNRHGVLAREIFIYFDPQQVRDILSVWLLPCNGEEIAPWTALVSECFCDDVQVVSSRYDGGHNKVIVTALLLPFVIEIFHS